MLGAPTWPSWPLSFESHGTEGHVSENDLYFTLITFKQSHFRILSTNSKDSDTRLYRHTLDFSHGCAVTHFKIPSTNSKHGVPEYSLRLQCHSLLENFNHRLNMKNLIIPNTVNTQPHFTIFLPDSKHSYYSLITFVQSHFRFLSADSKYDDDDCLPLYRHTKEFKPQNQNMMKNQNMMIMGVHGYTLELHSQNVNMMNITAFVPSHLRIFSRLRICRS